MIIQAQCKVHPNEKVVLLTATTLFLDESGSPTTESSERAVKVSLDEANLYCYGAGSDHEVGFVCM